MIFETLYYYYKSRLDCRIIYQGDLLTVKFKSIYNSKVLQFYYNKNGHIRVSKWHHNKYKYYTLSHFFKYKLDDDLFDDNGCVLYLLGIYLPKMYKFLHAEYRRVQGTLIIYSGRIYTRIEIKFIQNELILIYNGVEYCIDSIKDIIQFITIYL